LGRGVEPRVRRENFEDAVERGVPGPMTRKGRERPDDEVGEVAAAEQDVAARGGRFDEGTGGVRDLRDAVLPG
jgi:hypothetical protein